MNRTPPIVDVLKGLLKLVTDLQYFFHKDFIKENYYKHFFYSIFMLFPAIWLLRMYFQLDTTGLFFNLIIGGLLGFTINGIRESYRNYYKGDPFSWTDIYMGSYGGIVGAGLAVWVMNLIF